MREFRGGEKEEEKRKKDEKGEEKVSHTPFQTVPSSNREHLYTHTEAVFRLSDVNYLVSLQVDDLQ